jgi:NADH dehydrogenase [ubiquinone] 1 alpha subcomplex assembly factor 2
MEQSQDIVRQERLKVLAAQADARWAEKPSFLDPPREMGQPARALRIDEGWNERIDGSMKSDGGVGIEGKGDVAGEAEKKSQDGAPKAGDFKIRTPVPDEKRHRFIHGTVTEEGNELTAKVKEDPWKRTRGGPSDEWQPQAWNPNAATAKR